MSSDLPEGLGRTDQTILIDTSRLATFTQYAALRSLSQGRISQLKAESKIQTVFIPELGLELVVLEKSEYELGQRVKKPFKEALHTYSYKQLGGYFAELIQEYEQMISSADRLARQRSEEIARANTELSALTLSIQGFTEREAELLRLSIENQAALAAQSTLLLEAQKEIERLTPIALQVNVLEQNLTQTRQLNKDLEQTVGRLEKEVLVASTQESAQTDIRKELAELKKQVEHLINQGKRK